MKLRKKEDEVDELDDDDISITTYNDGDQTAHSIYSNDISSLYALDSKEINSRRVFHYPRPSVHIKFHDAQSQMFKSSRLIK